MEKRIKERYHEAVLQEAMRRYDIAAGQIHLLDGFESFMYEYERDSAAYILRIAHSFRRSPALIQGEVDWINYLAAGGTSVSPAIPSANGRLVETIADGQGEHFLVTAFVKAPGQPPWEVGWTPALFETYGQLLGRMHALTKGYRVPDPVWRRPQWDDEVMLDGAKFLPASEAVAAAKLEQTVAHLRALPRDDDSYGLTHFDAHGSNLVIDGDGTITLFDFDDCCYCWFVHDIAIVLFYIVMGAEDEAGFAASFLTHFLRGYRRENRLAPRWLSEIPHFLKLREVDMYTIIHRSFDVENLDDPWCVRYMRDRKRRIENDVPYLDLDFASLAGLLEP